MTLCRAKFNLFFIERGESMPISRHFEIIYHLLNKKKATAKELADHFEVSTRTIYRDIDNLSAAGIPIYSSQGKGGGIFLIDDYVFNTSLLSESEQDEILMALQSLNAAAYPEIDSVLSKLSNMFKKDKANWIEVDFSPWGSNHSQKELFYLLQEAIMNHHLIVFRYFNVSGIKSSRQVEPVKLLFKDKSWYLYGYCLESSAFRTFKVNRMKEVKITDIDFEPREKESSIENTQQNSLPELIEVKLRISSQGAFRVYDEFEEDAVVHNEDGSYTISTKMPLGSWLYSYILSFGTLIEDIEPMHLRNKILGDLDTIKKKINQRS